MKLLRRANNQNIFQSALNTFRSNTLFGEVVHPTGEKTMVKRRRKSTARRRAVGGKRGYKTCVVKALKRIKFTTPKAARRAFTRASKICRKKLAGKATVRRRKVGRRKVGKRRCKYGRLKGSKRCRKTSRSRRRR